MARDPIPTWFFSLVVVRLGHRFLVVQERKHGQLWYLPAGRAEAGETLVEAACRETLEEAGIVIVVEGLIRLEVTPQPGATRVRAVFVARPADDTPPKSVADDESLGARWITLEELDALPMRGPEVRAWFEYVARGGFIAPLRTLAHEGDPLDLI